LKKGPFEHTQKILRHKLTEIELSLYRMQAYRK
jgi:hypothetical protein